VFLATLEQTPGTTTRCGSYHGSDSGRERQDGAHRGQRGGFELEGEGKIIGLDSGDTLSHERGQGRTTAYPARMRRLVSDDYATVAPRDRARTYNPSVNSTTGCSRLALQTQGLDAQTTDYRGNLGGLWGTLLRVATILLFRRIETEAQRRCATSSPAYPTYVMLRFAIELGI